MENVSLLLNAVVEQAAKDYIKDLCNYHNAKPGKDTDRLKYNIDAIEKFFTGNGITAFTKLDGNYLMQRLKALVEEYDYDLRVIRKACSLV